MSSTTLFFLRTTTFSPSDCRQIQALATELGIETPHTSTKQSTNYSTDAIAHPKTRSLSYQLSRLLIYYALSITYHQPANSFCVQSLGMGKFALSAEKLGPLSSNLSLSHDKSAEIVLLSQECRSTLGVDIERLSRPSNWLALSQRFFAPEMSAWLQRQAEPNVAFLKAWTLTEALVKALGVGLKNQIRHVNFDYDHDDINLSARQNIDTLDRYWSQQRLYIDNLLISTVIGREPNQPPPEPISTVDITLDELFDHLPQKT